MLKRLERETLREMVERYGCTWSSFIYRFYILRWDIEKALTTPVHTKDFVEKRAKLVLKLHKEGFTTKQIAKEIGITTTRVCQIIKKNLTNG